MAAVARQDAPGSPIAGEGDAPRRKRMDYLTRALVLRLREGETPMSYADIATTLGISESSARRICQFDTADYKAGMQRLMRSGDLERLDEWAKASRVSAKRGYFQAAERWLSASGAIDAKPTTAVSVDARPTVLISMPFQLGAVPQPQPAIDVRKLPPPEDAA